MCSVPYVANGSRAKVACLRCRGYIFSNLSASFISSISASLGKRKSYAANDMARNTPSQPRPPMIRNIVSPKMAGVVATDIDSIIA